ncbi:hypothetical protein [Escherichia coli]|uniref:hypothetical protein n=1 Tax=Escherichia coli TaxID=562 RepID=UPI00241460CE|nr:hypothetical protein [Escherichia coli]WFM55456.1 hypothetical protein P6H31_06535 [Escherichia coli]
MDGTSDYLKDGEWPIDNGIIEVYAAPPVPVVPEEKPMPNALSMLEREITQLIGDAQEATVTGYELIAEAWRLMDGQDPKTSDWHSKASKYLNSNIVEKVDDDRIEAVKAVLRRLAGNSPVIPDGLSTVCAEAYQVVGVMADALGVFGDAAVQKVLDNLSQQKLVHRDVLPFSLPVTPDGWVMVPKEPTQAMIKAWLSEIANFRGHAAGYRAALEAAPQLEVNRG